METPLCGIPHNRFGRGKGLSVPRSAAPSLPNGTEATAVALLGCEEELLPSWRSISSPDPERLAEERRLFYVAATRAKDRLLITHAAERGRRTTGGASRFLAEAGLLHSEPGEIAA